jgi:Tol biopolymer transport system component
MESIPFRSSRTGHMGIYQKKLNSPDLVQLAASPLDYPGSWHKDGQQLAFVRGGVEGNLEQANADIYIYVAGNPKQIKPILQTRVTTRNVYAKDGKSRPLTTTGTNDKGQKVNNTTVWDSSPTKLAQ